ncbi:MAG: hypothetical protein ACF8PN_04455 [Phycisphaerales bacterium]
MTKVMSSIFGIVSVSLGVAAPVAAQHHHGGDVFLEVFGGRIVTSGIAEVIDPNTGDELSEILTHDTRVYPSEMGEFQPGWTDEPGFDSGSGTFPVGSEVGFDIMDALLEWDGAAFVSTNLTVSVSFANLSVGSGGGFVAGFSLPVSNNGEWHRHLEFELSDPSAIGIFALPLRLWSDDATIDASETFWIVFNHEDDEAAHEEAIEFAKDAYVPGMKFEDAQLAAGRRGEMVIHGAADGARVYFAYAFAAARDAATIPGCPGLTSVLVNPTIIDSTVAQEETATLVVSIPAQAVGHVVHIQAVDPANCVMANWITVEFID